MRRILLLTVLLPVACVGAAGGHGEANNYLKMGADKKGVFPPPKQNFEYCQG